MIRPAGTLLAHPVVDTGAIASFESSIFGVPTMRKLLALALATSFVALFACNKAEETKKPAVDSTVAADSAKKDTASKKDTAAKADTAKKDTAKKADAKKK